MRDSSLGLYESRLEVIKLMYQSFVVKQRIIECKQEPSELINIPFYKADIKLFVKDRLNKVVNILHFVLGYYAQFTAKL